MCGIVGVWTRTPQAHSDIQAQIRAMTDAISHRGPDDAGVWADESAGLALGHRRLSIIDLTPAGHQPMRSRNRRFVIVFNGEIYNFKDLRRELAGRGAQFQGTSDTEVILESCMYFGVEPTLAKLNGMFAIAIWDRETQELLLARDRMGEKPLYWATVGPIVLFASELKAMRAFTNWKPQLDLGAVAAYIRHGYVPSPFSIYEGVRKLPPGGIARITQTEVHECSYWNVGDAVAQGHADPISGSHENILAEFEALLEDSIERRMVSDVPLGAFLSGGYDSSTVAALMQKRSSRPIKTFTVGFDDSIYDESRHAEAVARHLGTEHTTFKVDAKDAIEVVPKLAHLYDEPFADPSMIPTHVLSSLARQHVTVVLSGDGGDELFTGYKRYHRAAAAWKVLSRVPAAMRSPLGDAMRRVPGSHYDSIASRVPVLRGVKQVGSRVHRVAGLMSAESIDDVYRRLVSYHDSPETVLQYSSEVSHPAWGADLRELMPDSFDRMRYMDMQTFLPDDILVKVDRASMAVALEVRVPFLDHRVVEWTWRLPVQLNARAGQPKYLIRKLLERYVPRALTDRPKMGFDPPVASWMRGSLRDWAEEMLTKQALERDDIFIAEPIRKAWHDLIGGSNANQYFLWSVLVFQSWRRAWL
jgi:asparagine synthase (glutamine-hydrolysing)